MNLIKTLIITFFISTLAHVGFAAHHASKPEQKAPIKALIVTGGCCHNYHFQTSAMTEGISKVANVDWTIVHQGGTGKDYELAFYADPNWAKPYDIVIHNECFAQTTNVDYIKQITEGHKTFVPAMVIHCAMHTYRDIEENDWRKFLGVTSKRHEHQSHYEVTKRKGNHPALKGMPDEWKTPMDELYIIEKLWPSATALATSASETDGKEYPVIWVNDFEGTRVFGTTYGHSDDTFRDPVYINLLAQGFLWASGK
jgi:uncharacterized protein